MKLYILLLFELCVLLIQCKDNSLNTDSFMSALSEGANETEIRSLRYNVNSHISHLQKTGVTGQHFFCALHTCTVVHKMFLNTSRYILDACCPAFLVSRV